MIFSHLSIVLYTTVDSCTLWGIDGIVVLEGGRIYGIQRSLRIVDEDCIYLTPQSCSSFEVALLLRILFLYWVESFDSRANVRIMVLWIAADGKRSSRRATSVISFKSISNANIYCGRPSAKACQNLGSVEKIQRFLCIRLINP